LAEAAMINELTKRQSYGSDLATILTKDPAERTYVEDLRLCGSIHETAHPIYKRCNGCNTIYPTNSKAIMNKTISTHRLPFFAKGI
jgi:hypothetical protein